MRAGTEHMLGKQCINSCSLQQYSEMGTGPSGLPVPTGPKYPNPGSLAFPYWEP